MGCLLKIENACHHFQPSHLVWFWLPLKMKSYWHVWGTKLSGLTGTAMSLSWGRSGSSSSWSQRTMGQWLVQTYPWWCLWISSVGARWFHEVHAQKKTPVPGLIVTSQKCFESSCPQGYFGGRYSTGWSTQSGSPDYGEAESREKYMCRTVLRIVRPEDTKMILPTKECMIEINGPGLQPKTSQRIAEDTKKFIILCIITRPDT